MSEQNGIDLTSLREIIYRVSPFGVSMIAGYPACSLMFKERNWRNRPREEKIIFSIGMGEFFAVLSWILIIYLKSIEKYRIIIEGNEVTLVNGLLILIAGVEIILISIRTAIRRASRKKRS